MENVPCFSYSCDRVSLNYTGGFKVEGGHALRPDVSNFYFSRYQRVSIK